MGTQSNNGNTTPIAKHTALANSEETTFSTISLQPTDGSHAAQAIDDECKVFIMSTCFKVVGFALNAVWFGFAVAALVKESNSSIVDECHASVLWPCLCTCCALSGLSALNAFIGSKKSDEDSNMAGALCNLLIVIGVAIWGAVELSRPCAVDELNTRAVYLMLLIWVVSTGAGVVILVFAMGYMCYACAKEESRSATDRPQRLNPISRDLERGLTGL